MKLTRPQRKRLAWVLFVVGFAAIAFMIWNQRLYAWTGWTGGGQITREFGLLRYLTITQQVSGPFGSRASQTIVASDWRWQPMNVAINGAITLVVGVLLAWRCGRMIRKERLIGTCDECGYDLTGLHSAECPECGANVSAPSRVQSP
jgi:hypothetical protein